MTSYLGLVSRPCQCGLGMRLGLSATVLNFIQGFNFFFQVIQAQPVVRQIVVDLKPPNYVVLSLLVMIFGCFLFGLIALVFALQVRRWSSFSPPLGRELVAVLLL